MITSRTYTIFYNRSAWHILMRDFMAPELLSPKTASLITQFSIFLSTNQGDRIDIAIYFKSHLAETLNWLTDFEHNLRNYLISNPSKNQIVKYPTNFFFMHYPNNTTWVNIVKIQLQNSKQLKVDCMISRMMLMALRDEELTVELLFTFAIYLQLGYLKSLFPTKEAVFKNIGSLGRFEKSHIRSYYLSSIECESLSLRDVIDEIWQTDNAIEYEWMKLWINFWNMTSKNLSSKCFRNVSEIVYRKFGFDTNQWVFSIKHIVTSFTQVDNGQLTQSL